MDTLILIDAITCCKGRLDRWGTALFLLCRVMAKAWRRPIAIIPCYRLGASATDPTVPPVSTCVGGCCNMRISSRDVYARREYHERLRFLLDEFCGFQTTVLAAGALAQWAALGPDKPLKHVPVYYPFFGRGVGATWTKNAELISKAVGYGDLGLFESGWLAKVTSHYFDRFLPRGVR